MDAVDTALSAQRSALSRTIRNGYTETISSTLRYSALRADTPVFSLKTAQRLTLQAERAVIAGKTVGNRISLIGGTQRTAVRQRLILGLRKGETPEKMVAAIEQFYTGVSTGNAGPAYLARRLVQSELTRINGLAAEEAAYLARKATGAITILVFHTQGDDRVRDAHEALEGQLFVEDAVAGEVPDAESVSIALDALSDPNCRCWLDIEDVR
jgi:uncharacterized protein with gpF-like domain